MRKQVLRLRQAHVVRVYSLCAGAPGGVGLQPGGHANAGVGAGAKVQRVVFGSAGFTESNRFWTVARPEHLQYDPFLETLLDVDPKTGEFTPRLAEKWEVSPDLKEWTFYLRKGVQFHYGFGEFTAKDVVHSHSFMLRPDATSATAPLWRETEEVKVVNDHQVVFRLKRPMSIIHMSLPALESYGSSVRHSGIKRAWRGTKNGRLALARTATSDAKQGYPSSTNGSTTTGVTNRISRK